MAWIDGYNNTDFIAFAGDAPLQQPYPDSAWRIDPHYYDGYPFITLWPDMADFHIEVAKQRPYICIYDIGTPKNGFENNGLSILLPSSCETTEDLNGMWNATLTHPIDPEGRWQNILQNNLLRINGQLFTIKSYDIVREKSQQYVYCNAEHVWYQQADGWIFPTYLIGLNGHYSLQSIKNSTYYHSDPQQHEVIYDFYGDSDIEWNNPETPEEDAKLWIMETGDGVTPIDAMIGSEGFVAQKGGELYRDNFYFSINSRKEDSRDDAFDIRIGKNLTGIRRTVDTTDFASYFRVYDEWGGWWACCWVLSEELQRQFPHQVVRSMKADRPYNANSPDFDYELYFTGVVIGQGEAWFKSHCKPVIGYEIDMVDITKNPDFLMISDERYVVGDRGRLFDPLLGASAIEVELTSVTRDELTGHVKRIVIGEQSGFTRPASPPVFLGLEVEHIGGEVWIQDANGEFCIDPSDNRIIAEV